jgi:hypothetical protein|tara:strand:- start:394 stop:657 length:264 start_codon:yes stop_codon:yes gene_type:complete
MEFNRDLVAASLRAGPVEIEFTKVNGESRVMKCTLNEAYIPAINMPKGEEKSLKKTAEVLPVYELDQGWKSFRWDSLKSWTKLTTYR